MGEDEKRFSETDELLRQRGMPPRPKVGEEDPREIGWKLWRLIKRTPLNQRVRPYGDKGHRE